MTRQVVLFSALDASGNDGLWVTNGTAAGTHELTGISGANSGGLDPTDLTPYGQNIDRGTFRPSEW
jgi:ELWxxDGT repeat protein